jgi:hypothetical protein
VSWLRRWVTEYLDLLIALVLTAVGQAEVWSGLVQGGPRLPVALLVGIGTLAVALRRSHPITAVLVTCGSMTAQTALGVDSDTAFAPLMAAFLAIGTAGYVSSRPLVALICAVGAVWPAVLISHGMPPATDAIHVAGDMLYAAILIACPGWSAGVSRSADCSAHCPRNGPPLRPRRSGCASPATFTTSWRTASA